MTETKYISSKMAAELLGISVRRVVGLYNNGEIIGAYQDGRRWKIPETSVYTYQREKRLEDEKLPCAVGSTSYVDTVKNCYYVDKTLLIRDLIDDHATVTLFTRPRRFGKTLAIDMLKVYFEKTDADSSIYFRDKKIWSCGEKYREKQGTYPVIYITFKDVKFDNWNDSLEAVRLVIRDEYMRHQLRRHCSR